MTVQDIKKKISSFLVGEEGQISKKALVGMGVILAGLGAGTAQAAHNSGTTATYPQPTLRGSHSSTHSSCHSSHANHANSIY